MNCQLPLASFFVTHESLSQRQTYQPCSSYKRGVKRKLRSWMGSVPQNPSLELFLMFTRNRQELSMQHTSQAVLTLLGFGKDFSKEKAGNVSELPQKQGGLDMTIPADQSTQNKLCIVPKDINKRFFNFHASLCNSSSSLHTCIWKCSLLKYKCPYSRWPSRKPGTSINNFRACQYPETHNTG